MKALLAQIDTRSGGADGQKTIHAARYSLIVSDGGGIVLIESIAGADGHMSAGTTDALHRLKAEAARIDKKQYTPSDIV